MSDHRKIKIGKNGEIEIEHHFGFGGFLGNALSGVVGDVGGLAGGIVGGVSNAMTAKNGYNAQLAPVDKSDYAPVINGASANALAGNGQFNNNLAQQQQLAAALGAQAQGQGPNPAQAMLANQTGANVANQGALAADSRPRYRKSRRRYAGPSFRLDPRS